MKEIPLSATERAKRPVPAEICSQLGRRFCGIEQDREYCLWSLARLEKARTDTRIQGYADGVFWERNTLAEQTRAVRSGENPGGH